MFLVSQDTPNQEACFKFVTDCADTVIPSYLPIVKKNSEGPYGEK
jgi:coproporphyrinogen III oxidase